MVQQKKQKAKKLFLLLMSKLIQIFKIYDEFKKYSGSIQSFIKNLSSEHKHIYDEIQNDKSYKYLIKFNLPWLQMSLIEWIQHPQHPCPIITISIQQYMIQNK